MIVLRSDIEHEKRRKKCETDLHEAKVRERVTLEREKKAKKLVLSLREQMYSLKKELRRRPNVAPTPECSHVNNCTSVAAPESVISKLEFNHWKASNHIWTPSPSRRKPPLDTRHPKKKNAFDACKRDLHMQVLQTPLQRATSYNVRFPRNTHK